MEIILEFGSNWRTLELYKAMLDQAVKYNFKYIKLQLFLPSQVPKEYEPYVIDEIKARKMYHLGKARDLEVFFTPCYPSAVDTCEKLGVSMYKVRYKDRHNKPLCAKITDTGKERVLISCADRFDSVYTWGDKLFCIPQYPANPKGYDRHYTGWDGISDHTRGTALLRYIMKSEPSLKWFEKHVCLDKNCLESKWSVPINEVGSCVF